MILLYNHYYYTSQADMYLNCALLGKKIKFSMKDAFDVIFKTQYSAIAKITIGPSRLIFFLFFSNKIPLLIRMLIRHYIKNFA